MHCRHRCSRFPEFLTQGGALHCLPGCRSNSDSYASCATGFATSKNVEPRPVRMQATGRAARGVCRALLVSDQRCIERPHGEATQRADTITPVHSSQELWSGSPISFSRLFGLHKAPSVEGRRGAHTTAGAAQRTCQQCCHRLQMINFASDRRQPALTFRIPPILEWLQINSSKPL